MAIFTSSCQHAAVNFSQMETYSFAPNSPATLRKPPPTKKGEVTLEHIMESLPSKHLACMMIAFMYDLTRVYPTEVRFHLCCFPRYATKTLTWCHCWVHRTKTPLRPSTWKHYDILNKKIKNKQPRLESFKIQSPLGLVSVSFPFHFNWNSSFQIYLRGIYFKELNTKTVSKKCSKEFVVDIVGLVRVSFYWMGEWLPKNISSYSNIVSRLYNNNKR